MCGVESKELLKNSEGRPVGIENIPRNLSINNSECSFVNSLKELNDETVMKVFGQKVSRARGYTETY